MNKSIQSVKFEPMFSTTKQNDSIYGSQDIRRSTQEYESQAARKIAKKYSTIVTELSNPFSNHDKAIGNFHH